MFHGYNPRNALPPPLPRFSGQKKYRVIWLHYNIILTAHRDHLSRGDEHDQAPAEVQGVKIGPDLGPVSLNDLRGGCDVALPVYEGIDLPIGAKRNSIGNARRHQLPTPIHREAVDGELVDEARTQRDNFGQGERTG